MKLLIAVCTIFVLSFINSSDAECSDKSWVSVKNIDGEKILGRWFAVLRFANGNDDSSDCLWHDLAKHSTIPNAIQAGTRRSFKNGRGHTRKTITGTLSKSDPTKGRFNFSFKNGGVAEHICTALDYDEYSIVRACFENEEFFWAYTRNQYPSNETLTKMYTEIDAQGIDRSKIIESCTNVGASVIA